MSVQRTDLPSMVSGTYFRDLNLRITDADGTPYDLTNKKAKAEVKLNPKLTDSAKVWDTTDNTIEIVDGPDGRIKLKGFHNDIPPGDYYYDLKVELAPDEVYAILCGKWIIVQHVTQL